MLRKIAAWAILSLLPLAVATALSWKALIDHDFAKELGIVLGVSVVMLLWLLGTLWALEQI